ncbi:PIG-X [Jimgerdemannia flammicorona]|uniref:Protein PBN1 n=2 Tax=Jimgerdemannia flammicorona TaxID=994334 RepID=A0A433D3P6_9FUNG|nr:PIG-X [Jimgerdemannia flammicorona]RUS28328.1 PIG-X [Jimgerdemannia flammicorona]
MSRLNSTLAPSHSLHPHIITHLYLHKDNPLLTPPSPACILDIVYILPSAIFPDQYQLHDLRATLGDNVLVYGELDLEKPLESVNSNGSVVLVRYASTNVRPDEDIVVDLPLHLRYQSPAKASDTDPDRTHNIIEIPRPIAGWTCPMNMGHGHGHGPDDHDHNHDHSAEDVRIALASLRRLPPPYIQHPLPKSRTAVTFLPILYVEEATEPMCAYVPIGRAQDVGIVAVGTYVAVVLGSVWIAWAVWETVVRRWRWEAKGKMKKSE